jgi:hypothetical protein
MKAVEQGTNCNSTFDDRRTEQLKNGRNEDAETLA